MHAICWFPTPTWLCSRRRSPGRLTSGDGLTHITTCLSCPLLCVALQRLRFLRCLVDCAFALLTLQSPTWSLVEGYTTRVSSFEGISYTSGSAALIDASE